MPFIDALTTTVLDLIRPIQWLVAWVMVRFHDLWTAVGLDPAGGAAWALSIVGLVVVVRLALVPLYVRQVRAMRRMQAIQPEIRALQAKYRGRTDPAGRQALQREQVELLRTARANPMGGCLPALLQAPVLFALFTTLDGLRQHETVGALTAALVRQADAATLFTAPLSASLWGSGHAPTVVLAIVLVAAMVVTQFLTQKLVIAKNTAPAAVTGDAVAQQQRVLLYALPLLVAVPGLHVPIGVLLYWLTSTLWSLAQQVAVIRRMPNPGSVGEAELLARRARRAARTSSR